MGKLDVIVVTTSYPISAGSVSGIFVARLLEAMSARVNFTVLIPAAPGFEPVCLADNIQVKTFRYAPARWQVLTHRPGGIPVALKENPLLLTLVPFFLLFMFLALWRLSKNTNLIHANWSICGFIAGMVGKLRCIPVVTTLRGEDLNRASLSNLHIFFVRCAMRFSRRVITVSNAFEKRLEALFPEFTSKCQTISNGVGEEFIRIGARRFAQPLATAQDPRNRPLRIVTVCSLIPRKGVDVILKALAYLPDPETVALTIAGDGAEKNSLTELAGRLGIDKQVEFVGELAPSQIVDLLESQDVFVLASHSEGKPNVILEAKAAGLPVIASNIDGVREIIVHGQDGLLFTDNSPDQLAEEINRLLLSPQARLLYAARAHRYIVENNLTWHNAADQYLSVYRSALLG